MESEQDFEEAVTYYSVFTLVQVLMKEARFLDTAGDYIGLGTLSALFVVKAVALYEREQSSWLSKARIVGGFL